MLTEALHVHISVSINLASCWDLNGYYIVLAVQYMHALWLLYMYVHVPTNALICINIIQYSLQHSYYVKSSNTRAH